MTNEKDVSNPIREPAATDAHHAHQAHARRRWTDFLKHRWPTALAIALAVLSASGLEDGSEFYVVLFISGLGYLAPAALNRPWIPWAVLVLSIPAVDAMRALGVEPAVGLLVTTLIFLVLGFAR